MDLFQYQFNFVTRCASSNLVGNDGRFTLQLIKMRARVHAIVHALKSQKVFVFYFLKRMKMLGFKYSFNDTTAGL